MAVVHAEVNYETESCRSPFELYRFNTADTVGLLLERFEGRYVQEIERKSRSC